MAWGQAYKSDLEKFISYSLLARGLQLSFTQYPPALRRSSFIVNVVSASLIA